MSSGSYTPPPSIRILLLEDNAGDAQFLQELLADALVPFTITIVDRLEAALTRLDLGDIDVVISDLTLPDSIGDDTFRRLDGHPASVPVIILTGLADESLALRLVEAGAQDYLVKGQIDQPLLVRAIRYAINRGKAEQELARERNLLRSVVDNLVDAVYVKDLSGRYLLGNAAHARQLGIASSAEVIGKTSADFFPAEIARGFQTDDEYVMRTGDSILNRHECVTDGDHPTRWLSTTKAPLRDRHGNVVGIVGIGRDITSRKKSEEQLARYTEELREKNAEMEDDLNMAREVQLAFLPQQFPTFPSATSADESALRFYSKYLPTTTLGGDFFHVMPISDTKAGVLICDVMGHGVRAALVTAIQRALVEELTEYAGEPGAFLTQMNDALLSILRRTRSPMFASAFYAVMDVEEGLLRYANAGHPRPVLIRRSTAHVSLLDQPGERPSPALGVFAGSRYPLREIEVCPQDLLVLFTDGLYEVEDSAGEYYDQSLLLQAFRRRLDLPTETMFEETIDEVRRFSATRDFIDDVCMVGMEVCSYAAVSSHGALPARELAGV